MRGLPRFITLRALWILPGPPGIAMKEAIHPQYTDVKVICSCGNKFTTRSSVGKPELHIEVCSNCHPFYTGKQKTAEVGGRVDKFKKRYAKKEAA